MLELEDYYKTDTHWKQERLLKVAKTIAESMNVNLENEYKKKTIAIFKAHIQENCPFSPPKTKLKNLQIPRLKKAK